MDVRRAARTNRSLQRRRPSPPIRARRLRCGGADPYPEYPPLYHRTWPGFYYGGKWRAVRGDTRILGTNPYTWRAGLPVAEDDMPPTPSALNRGVNLAVLYDPARVLVPKQDLTAWQAHAPTGLCPTHLALLAPEVAFPSAAEPASVLDVAFEATTGYLLLPGVPQDGGAGGRFKPMYDGRFHIQDWALFFGNLRQNVRERLAAHKKRHSSLLGGW